MEFECRNSNGYSLMSHVHPTITITFGLQIIVEKSEVSNTESSDSGHSQIALNTACFSLASYSPDNNEQVYVLYRDDKPVLTGGGTVVAFKTSTSRGRVT